MYHMKTIVSSDERITLPKCMYRIRNLMEIDNIDDTEINISEQVTKFLKKYQNPMMELEERQDKLLLKLDKLYERIKDISLLCKTTPTVKQKIVNRNIEEKYQNPMMELEERQDKLLLKLDKLYERVKDISLLCKTTPTVKQKVVNRNIEEKLDKEIVLVLDPEVLPWFLIMFIKGNNAVNLTWHIHSNVDKKKISKINNFFKKNQQLSNQRDSKTNVRLIFKNVASAAELIVSSLEIPIVGTVNIIRYLCLNFTDIVPYDYTDHNVESLLDLAFLLERASEKVKEKILNQIFSQSKNWIYKNEFSIIDLAVYNAVKQSQNLVKYIPKQWYDNCEKICYIEN